MSFFLSFYLTCNVQGLWLYLERWLNSLFLELSVHIKFKSCKVFSESSESIKEIIKLRLDNKQMNINLIFLNGTPCILLHFLKGLLFLISNIPYMLTFGSAVFVLYNFKVALNLHYMFAYTLPYDYTVGLISMQI